MENDYNLFHHSVSIIAGANMASKEELKESLEQINDLIGTGYYEDADGNYLLSQITFFLEKKIKR